MKYKATEKFKELGIDNSYQGLQTWQYYDLRLGKEVEIELVPVFLIENNFIKEIEKKEPKEYKVKGK